jgi:hypothetical protein
MLSWQACQPSCVATTESIGLTRARCENSKALNALLKEELGFQGYEFICLNGISTHIRCRYVMSDWGATHSGLPAILVGPDMDTSVSLTLGKRFSDKMIGAWRTVLLHSWARKHHHSSSKWQSAIQTSGLDGYTSHDPILLPTARHRLSHC